MSTEENLSYIDQYVKGTLSETDRNNFAEKLEQDKDFRALYEFVLSVESASYILEAQRIKKLLSNGSFEAEGQIQDISGEGSSSTEDTSSKPTKPLVVPLWSLLKYIAVAAVLLIIFLVWQPNKSSNNELFAYYQSGTINFPPVDIQKIDYGIEGEDTRGNDFLIKSYTNEETQQLLEALDLVNKREYAEAKEILARLLTSKERSPELLIFLAISQLNTGEIEKAVINLNYLLKIPKYVFREDAKFHLAMGYLYLGNSKKAQLILRELKMANGKYAKESSFVLNEMRWF